MEYKINKISDTESEIKAKIEPKRWEEAVEKVYEQKKGQFDMQGWRKGKVPRRVIEQTHGSAVFYDDAITALANEVYQKVLEENKTFDPVGDPDLNIEKLDDLGLEFSIKVAVVPPVELATYKGLTVEANLAVFDEKMVNAELEKAQIHKTENKPVDRASKKGDVVVIDFVGSVDGVEFEGGKAKNHSLELGSGQFIEGFEEQLVGYKAGDKADVNVTFPKDYGAQQLDGKPAVFKCEIKSVNTKVLPELDDKFAKLMGDYKNFAEYRNDVAAQVKHSLEEGNKSAREDAVLGNIVKNSKVELPKPLIQHNLDHIMKDLEYRLACQGISLADYAKYTKTTEEAIRESRQQDAEALTKTKLVLEALVRAENLMVDDAEIDAKLKEIAKIQNKSLEDVKKTFDAKRLDHLYSDILMGKLTTFLMANNTVVSKKIAPKTKSAPKSTKK